MNNKRFGNRYDEVYKKGMQKSVWPWTSVVVILNKLKKYLNPNAKILELGCGMGANIEFVHSLGYQFYGIDFSDYAVKNILKYYPNLTDRIVDGDFTKELPFLENNFDLILDRASLTCNATSDIRNCIELIKNKLIKGGYFVGIDWYSTDHSGYKIGKRVEDDFSLSFEQNNLFFDPPRMHFSNKDHIFDLFKDFKIIHIEHSIIEIFNSELSNPEQVASWNFVVRLDKQ